VGQEGRLSVKRMPRRPALRIAALQRLDRQLRYEPPDAARLKLDRAVALLLELLEPGAPGTLPESYVLFRLTGLRLEAPDEPAPALLVRDALLGDLAALIDRLSAAARLETPEGWLTAEDLLARWNISRVTLTRLRRRGLAGYRVTLGPERAGRERVLFDPALLPAFERAFTADLARAGSARRTDAPEADRIRALAKALLEAHTRPGARPPTLWGLAAAIARQTGRGPGAVRRVLTRPGPAGEPALFTPRPKADARTVDRLSADRAGGVPLSKAARAAGRSRQTAYRLIAQRTAARLRGLDLSAPAAPVLDRPDAAEVLLAPPAVSAGLGARWLAPAGDALLLSIDTPAPPNKDELAQATALALLKRRAAKALAALPRSYVPAAALDDIVSDLLWAARLKAALVLANLPLVARAGATAIDAAPADLPPAARDALARAAIDALVDAIDRFDPFKGGRLSAAAATPIARALARSLQALPQPSRALARRTAEPAPQTNDFTRRCCPWQAELDLLPPALDRLDRLSPLQARVVEARFGLTGPPPRPPAAIAAELDLRPARVAQILRVALTRLSAPA
jgi:hypothetical protein